MTLFFTITLCIRDYSLHFTEGLGVLPKVTQVERDVTVMYSQICRLLSPFALILMSCLNYHLMPDPYSQIGVGTAGNCVKTNERQALACESNFKIVMTSLFSVISKFLS